MQTTNKTILSKNLQRLMDERGWKQVDLSFASRVPYSRIGDILRSKTRNPQINTVTSLAKALEVTVDDLVTDPADQKLSA